MEKNNITGFTLLELIVVLVIVGLMAGLVLPRLLGSFTTVELRSSGREMATILRQSRDTAYFKKKVKASFDLDTDHIIVSRYQRKSEEEAEESNFRPKMEWKQIKTLSFPKNVTLAKATNRGKEFNQGKFEILFFPDGNSSGGKILLQNHRGRQLLIGVDLMTGTVLVLEE